MAHPIYDKQERRLRRQELSTLSVDKFEEDSFLRNLFEDSNFLLWSRTLNKVNSNMSWLLLLRHRALLSTAPTNTEPGVAARILWTLGNFLCEELQTRSRVVHNILGLLVDFDIDQATNAITSHPAFLRAQADVMARFQISSVRIYMLSPQDAEAEIATTDQPIRTSNLKWSEIEWLGVNPTKVWDNLRWTKGNTFTLANAAYSTPPWEDLFRKEWLIQYGERYPTMSVVSNLLARLQKCLTLPLTAETVSSIKRLHKKGEGLLNELRWQECATPWNDLMIDVKSFASKADILSINYEKLLRKQKRSLVNAGTNDPGTMLTADFADMKLSSQPSTSYSRRQRFHESEEGKFIPARRGYSTASASNP